MEDFEAYVRPAAPPYAIGRKVSGEEGANPLARLTPRLREILQLIVEGYTTKETARLLHTSPKTVENHRARLMQRLGIRDVASLVRYALQHGLIHTRR